MLAAISKRNPARRYFAALLPLCKNLIMDGKLQKNYEVNCHYYKVIRLFNKTLPYCQWPNRLAQASHPSTSPKTNDLRQLRLLCAESGIFQACVCPGDVALSRILEL